MNRAPRVLVLGHVLAQPPGGVARVASQVLPRAAKQLAEKGGELLVLHGSREMPAESLGAARSIPSQLPAGPPLARWLREGRTVRSVLAAEARAGTPVDVVHTGHLPLPSGSLQRGVTLVWQVHDLRRADTRLGRLNLRRAARRAAGIVTVSRFVARELADLVPAARERTAIAPNGVDHFTPLPRASEPSYLLHLGHLEPRKNVELLLRALQLDPKLPNLLCAGAPKSGERERLERLASELGVARRVEFRGAFADAELPRLLAGSACVVVPSFVEGFGLAAAEALHAGVPLAIARAGALPEIAGPFGVSFHVERPPECVHAIRTAMVRPASELNRGVRHARRFRWDRSATKLVEAWSRFSDRAS